MKRALLVHLAVLTDGTVIGAERVDLQARSKPLDLEKVVPQAEGLGNGDAEKSPFAQALAKFPKSVPPEDQKRIQEALIAVIRDQIQPAYRESKAAQPPRRRAPYPYEAETSRRVLRRWRPAFAAQVADRRAT